ncbi:MAG TPA: ABC transporter ATP-binding protein [Bacillota bacterium]|nr:ABC transporter ATP-binding protein [Bacillota bacterium]HPZ90367.1 ABC transporter ATP-binding protein [Bacillota bacterium]HQE02465.1 ABC transporter ATP-binding protein [Bacillota bacterium]
MSEANIVSLKSVSKWYGKKPGVLDCNVDIPQGKITALIGKNGTGKTTTIKMIMGYLRPTTGKVVVGGKPRNLLTVNHSIGYLPESLRFPELYTVGQLFESLAGMRGLRYREVKPFLEIARDLLELHPHWKKTLRSCSKGTRQKVGIIQAFMHNPQLVILDEPTTGLDPAMRHNFFELLRQRQKQGVSIIISSHNLKEIEDQADYYMFFHQNRIIKTAGAEELEGDGGTCILTDKDIPASLLPQLATLSATVDDNKVLVSDKGLLNQVLSVLIQAGIGVKNVQAAGANLESYFLNLLNQGGGGE